VLDIPLGALKVLAWDAHRLSPGIYDSLSNEWDVANLIPWNISRDVPWDDLWDMTGICDDQ